MSLRFEFEPATYKGLHGPSEPRYRRRGGSTGTMGVPCEKSLAGGVILEVGEVIAAGENHMGSGVSSNKKIRGWV